MQIWQQIPIQIPNITIKKKPPIAIPIIPPVLKLETFAINCAIIVGFGILKVVFIVIAPRDVISAVVSLPKKPIKLWLVLAGLKVQSLKATVPIEVPRLKTYPVLVVKFKRVICKVLYLIVKAVINSSVPKVQFVQPALTLPISLSFSNPINPVLVSV